MIRATMIAPPFPPFGRRLGSSVFALALAWSPLVAHAADATAPDTHATAELVAEHTAWQRGQTAWLGIRIHHEPHWHTYWINPGDSGLPTRLTWNLPSGVRAGEIDWPAPKRVDVGGLYNFGYEGDVLLPVAIAIPADAPLGPMHVGVDAKWLVCREECIPSGASLAIDLPVQDQVAPSDTRWLAAFADARLAQPQATSWKGEARVADDRVAITLRGADLPDAAELDVFAIDRKVLDNAPAKIQRDGDTLVIDAGKSDYFDAAPAAIDLVITSNAGVHPRAWRAHVPFATPTN